MQTVSLTLFRFDGWQRRLRALALMGLARPAMRRGVAPSFWKLCGSGTGEGFTPVPDTAVYAVLATWPDLPAARVGVTTQAGFRRFARHADEHWTVFLSPISARGAWSGTAPFRPQPDERPGPVAALTRATVRPRALLRFWRRVPQISTVIGADTEVLFKIGIGEVPLLHQVTFSVWPDTASMARFARADGPHARAIRAVREGGWFREELYARFRVLGDEGTWRGARPLGQLEAAA
jgi:spheroidene monooxygenase